MEPAQRPVLLVPGGFEVRTYRLCQRVLMFHHFPGDPAVGADCLVRSTDFTYSYEDNEPDPRDPIFSFLLSTTQTGYKREPGGYLSKSLPPLEFEYTQPIVQEEIHEVDPENLENLPYGLDNGRYQWVDLDGEGLSGVLTEQAEGWFYKRNLSPIKEEGEETVVPRFAPLEQVAQKPSMAAVTTGRQQFLDLAGDGQLDLVQLEAPTPGFYERTHDESWESFAPFTSLPVLDWDNPNLKFVDLTGDGHADILISEYEVFCWHPSLAEAGFGPPERIRKQLDEEKGPRLVFADGTQSIYLADLSGDGLTDLVRVRNGEVCYWPNLGYGRFGAKVTMDKAPWFEAPDLFDQRRMRLADIDGSGITDIIYLGHDGVHLYFNQSGNSWSDARQLAAFPAVDNLSSVQVVDLLGNGTACLLWSSSLPGDARRPMRYLDLMGGQKPHLLVKTVNNLGAETHVQYAPSTKFYLTDKLAGKPWITRLPFPVHVVERVETHDHVSRNHFTTRYEYHHGYFDGEERELRGFGRVDQFDTEKMAALTAGGALPVTNIDAASHVPPVLTKTWFHTGAYLGRDRVSNFFAGLLGASDKGEYYREPGLDDEQHNEQAAALLLDDTLLPAGLTVEEEREACRALKGSMLRQEVYALDGTEKEIHPYTVTEQNFTIERMQPRAGNRHGVFFTHAREAINYHYERNPADPRITHALTLEVDPFGNVLKAATIGYGRRETIRIVDAEGNITEVPNPELNKLDPLDRPKQTQTLITYTENRVTDAIDDPAVFLDDYRTPQACETRTYELTGYPATGEDGRFKLSDFVEPTPANSELKFNHIFDEELNYEAKKTTGRQRRLIEHVRTLYRSDNLQGPLALGELHSLALPFESYKLAFTPELLSSIYQRKLDNQPPEDLLPNPTAVLGGKEGDKGGYVDLDDDGHWWIPSGHVFFDPTADIANPAATAAPELAQAREHFFLPRKYADPFGHSSTVDYDDDDLLVRKTQDAADNVVSTVNDYRVLQPSQITDPNGNRSEVTFDALGMVAGTAVKGKDDSVGDTLSEFNADPTHAETDEFYDADDPHVPAANLLKGATTCIIYDLDRFRRTHQAHPNDPTQWLPVYAATLARETHVSDPPPDGLKIQISFSYSDGFEREIQKKIQAEPGALVEGGPVVSPRWVGSGWTVFNNKGKPVRQYEPFFSQLPEKRHRFEFGVEVGVSPVLFYDPAERGVATLHPNHTWEKIVFNPWQQETWDVSDTATLDPRNDEHVKGFFLNSDGTPRLPTDNYLPTWHALRTDPANAAEANQKWPDPKIRDAEKDAAEKTAVHANTPIVAHLDTLGRTFLTIAHNRFERDDAIVEEKYPTRIELDIEGNQREVRDAVVQNGDSLGRIVMQYDYDTLGNRIHQASQEAGERWMLNDVTGKPIRAWDSRGHTFTTEYDPLRRPLRQFVRGTDANHSDPRTLNQDALVEKTEYGEGQPNHTALNLRTRVFKHFDAAGVVTSMGRNPVTNQDEAYDFKGNLLRSSRQLVRDYQALADWQQNPALEQETFTTSTTYDALNRPTAVTAPDHSIYRPTYNEANLLDKVDVNLRGAATATSFVTNIDYDAKGQRTRIDYGNDTRTDYEYDKETFRLVHLNTLRGGTALQDLRYTYDPVGNITSIRDDAQQTVYFNNAVVEPHADYTYDAIYRLISATGREHIGQVSQPQTTWDDEFRINLPHPHDGQAMRRYTEQFEYDEVGNILEVIHQATNGDWTGGYGYNEASLIEPATKKSNRLSGTTIGQTTETYTYDAHGNMTAMPHLTLMLWDFEDQLRATSKQAVNNGTPETTFYVYDASGQRVRKVTERQNGTRKDERIYLGGFEVYREYNGNSAAVTLERETLHVMDDKQRIALVETKTVDNANLIDAPLPVQRYQFGNHLGSASLELDKDGGLISYEEYHPYGTTAYQAMNSAAEVSLKRYRYTGKERDEETGLYYHGARYYACWLGRWISADLAGLADGPNLYTYVQGRVARATDPTGFVTDEQLAFGGELTPEQKQKALGEGLKFAAALTLGAVVITLTGGESTANAPRTADEPRYNAVTYEEVVINAAAGASLGFYLGRIAGPIVAKEIQAAAQTAKGGTAAPKTPTAVTPAKAPPGAPAVPKGAPESAPAVPKGAPESAPAVPKPAAPKSSGKATGATSTPVGAGTPVEPVAALPTDVKAFTEAFHASEGKLLNRVASDLQVKLSQAGVKNRRLAIAVSAGVVDDKIRYVVTVSDPKALAVLRQYEKYLPEGLKVAVSEPKLVGGKLDPLSHVEIVGPAELLDEGAKGVVTGTNIPACKGSCEPLWAGESGTPPGNVLHTNRRKP